MRKVTFGVACSLDGYIARPDHRVDWLRWDEEVEEITSAFWATIDTVVMGRKTYEVAVRSGMPAYPGVKNYVVSHTLERAAHPEVEIVDRDAGRFVRALKDQPGAGICVMGGGELAGSLFVARAIDEVDLNVHPVLLGAGVPLFHPLGHQLDFDLLECLPLRNGCVFLRYRPRYGRGRWRPGSLADRTERAERTTGR